MTWQHMEMRSEPNVSFLLFNHAFVIISTQTFPALLMEQNIFQRGEHVLLRSGSLSEKEMENKYS